MALPDFSSIFKTVADWEPPGSRFPNWLLDAFHPYQDEVRRASRIEVRRDEASASTTIMAYYYERSFAVRLSDEFLVAHGEFPPEPLPVVRSPYPILGWREWVLKETSDGKEGMFGLFGQYWDTPLMKARCAKGHVVPAEGCRCGIYSTKKWMFHWSPDHYATGLVVATNVIEHEYGYRVGLALCIAINRVHPKAYGWDGIPILSDHELVQYATALSEDPSLIPYPNDLPAP